MRSRQRVTNANANPKQSNNPSISSSHGHSIISENIKPSSSTWKFCGLKGVEACIAALFMCTIFLLFRWWWWAVNNKGSSVVVLLDTESSPNIPIGPTHLTQTRRTPNQHACDGYQGIYHIQSGDVGGAAATIFFQFVIAQLIWAQNYNYKPWVYFNNISHHVYDQNIHNRTNSGIQFTMLKGQEVEHFNDIRFRRAAYPGKPYDKDTPLHPHVFEMSGDGVWEHYFEPVSDFVPGDSSCQNKPLLTMDLWLITPGLHIYTPWTPRMWRYDVLPDYMQQRHLTLREWLTPQRIRANNITQTYIRVKPHLWAMADQLLNSVPNNRGDNDNLHCIGMHVRWSDKGGGRRIIGVDEFLPFVERFLQTGGNCVMVATDSGKALDHMLEHWPERVRAVLKFQGDNVVRSNDGTPVFEMTKANQLVSHHRTNTEVLVDILALSRCKFLLHGHSAVSDSAMYLNADLIYQSLNLEDPDDFSLDDFGHFVEDILSRKWGSSFGYSRYFPEPWWKQKRDDSELATTPNSLANSCVGFDGILLISIGGGDDFSFGMTFFHFILNQLLYADKHNLKPWVHISKDAASAVYDNSVHGKDKQQVSFETMLMNVKTITSRNDGRDTQSFYPGDLDAQSTTQAKITMTVQGNGVWSSYFAPVSDFDPSNSEVPASCQDKPVVSLNKDMVLSGLHKWAPWSIKSFRYSGIPDQLWWHETTGVVPVVQSQKQGRLFDWYFAMRKQAHDIVKKYYHVHPYIWKRAKQVNPVDSTATCPSSKCRCLAVHIRQGDKEGYGKRKITRLRDYTPFIEAFFKATNSSFGADENGSYVYLATDAWKVMDAAAEKWQPWLTSRLHSQGKHVVRSVRWVPAHLLEPDNHHRVNLEALVDVLAMSQCHFLLHGLSTISEAAIYVNLDLHNHSVNLDKPNHLSVEEFEEMVKNSIEA